MEQSIDRKTDPAHKRLEENYPPRGSQHSPGFFQKSAGRAQMMENVQQDQMRNAAVSKGQLIGITHHIDPRVGKEISAEGFGQMGLDVADAGTDFHNLSRGSRINELDDARKEVLVDRS